MAKKPAAQACANLAIAEADGDLIPYVLGKETLGSKGADCQGLVEAVVRALGGEMAYRGSNDIFRNGCSYVAPLDQAIREGRLVPGAVLFIVKNDGGEQPRYKDGKGNATHIGWYAGGRYEVVHSSSSMGKVAPSTLKNAWTHVGWLKAVDYLREETQDTPTAEVVAVSGSTVRMRVRPDKTAVVNANVPVGAVVKVLQQQPDWWQISHGSKTGWMAREFLRLIDGVVEDIPDDPDPVDIDRAALLVEMQGMLTRQQAIIRALMGVM